MILMSLKSTGLSFENDLLKWMSVFQARIYEGAIALMVLQTNTTFLL